MPNPVKTKLNFYKRFHNGEFGNHGPMWNSFEEWLQAKYSGLIAIRTRIPGGRCDYNVKPSEVEARIKDFNKKGWNTSLLHFSAMCPLNTVTLQGEITRGTKGLEGFLTYRKLPMRYALSIDGFISSGLQLIFHLKRSMAYFDYEHLQFLLDKYPDHVVEFTAFSSPWGVIPQSRCVIWEVRMY